VIDYDLEIQRLNDVLRRAYGIRASDRVLHIGCGAGQTTREAARLMTSGLTPLPDAREIRGGHSRSDPAPCRPNTLPVSLIRRLSA
jgi:hypothetical protein